MGNYKNFEIDFLKRTLALISQYESILHKYNFNEQYNYTLLINCLLGLIIFPKANSLSYIPNQTLLDKKWREEMGLKNTLINPKYKNLKDLIIDLRNAVAHSDIVIESSDNNNLIDQIIFNDATDEIARFAANELLPFIRYYSSWVISNLEKHKI
ncbi:MAG TPA: HEPN family nuclease [Bacteroidia bacterium]|nr:HEPN family nuclease [Bacteroidia bacterium]